MCAAASIGASPIGKDSGGGRHHAAEKVYQSLSRAPGATNRDNPCRSSANSCDKWGRTFARSSERRQPMHKIRIPVLACLVVVAGAGGIRLSGCTKHGQPQSSSQGMIEGRGLDYTH